MNDSLALRQPVTATLHLGSYNEVKDLAQMLSAAPAGMVPKAYQGSAPGIFACLLRGIGLGLDPMEALANIHVIEGKAVLSSELMLSLVMRKGVRVEWTTMNDEEVECRLTRPGHPVHIGRWTIEDAKRAGLTGKDNWKRYPRAMLRARCISEAIRAWAPDLLGSGVYDETEADEIQERAASSAPRISAVVESTAVKVEPVKVAPADRAALVDASVKLFEAAQTEADMLAAKESCSAHVKPRTKEESAKIGSAAAAARVRLDAAKAAKVAEVAPDEAAEIARAEREAEAAA